VAPPQPVVYTADVGHQLCPIRRFGLRHYQTSKDPKGRTYRGVRQQFVKVGGSRGDQVAVISGVKPVTKL